MRLERRFFPSGAPAQLADDRMWLFDAVRIESQSRTLAKHGKWSRGCALDVLEEMETALAAAEASPARRPASRVRIRELAQAIERRGDKLRDVTNEMVATLRELGPLQLEPIPGPPEAAPTEQPEPEPAGV